MSKNIVIATLGAVLALSSTTQTFAEEMGKAPKGMEKCYGVAKAGYNECTSATTSCAGESKIDGDKTSWMMLPEGTCHKIVGGSTEPGKNKTS